MKPSKEKKSTKTEENFFDYNFIYRSIYKKTDDEGLFIAKKIPEMIYRKNLEVLHLRKK